MLVTALEANTDVPALSVVTERLIHEEVKARSRSKQTSETEEALSVRSKRKPICYFCRNPRHIKRNCEEYAKVMKEKSDEKPKHHKSRGKMGAFKVTITAEDDSGSGSEGCDLVIAHALSVGPNAKSQWILDSGATCHMCNDKTAFESLYPLPTSTNVTVGDRRSLSAAGKGNVTLNMNLPEGKRETCTLHDVLYVPDLA